MKNMQPTLLGELIGTVQAVPVVGNDRLAARPGERHVPDSLAVLIEEINRVIAPPVPVSGDAVFIRAMEVVSDEVNEHGGRFSTDEFGWLCELIIDSPVLVAHDKRQLPVARNFKAEVITREGRPWVKVWFYWPKDATGAQDLASRIDSGVLREVSIGFEFKRPECSVCGADIRECEHQPFAKGKHPDGTVRPVHYIYRDIVRVLETSLVYRGATPGTRIGAGLFFHKTCAAKICRPRKRFGILAALCTTIERMFDVGLANGIPVTRATDVLQDDSRSSRFVVTPLVEGVPVAAVRRKTKILLYDPDQNEFSIRVPGVCDELARNVTADLMCFGWLVRPRRKSKNTEVTLFVEWMGSVNDEDFLPHPIIEHRQLISRLFGRGKLIRPLPYRWVDREQLARAAMILSSAAGCRIHPAEATVSPPPVGHEVRRRAHLWLQITDRESTPDGLWRYQLALADGDDFREVKQWVESPQKYPVGRVVPVVGSLMLTENRGLRMFDAKIRYTPARRNQPDSLKTVRRMSAVVKAIPRQVA